MNFYIDMGKKPTPEHTIERINNNGNYEPNNCRWATRTEQSRNHRCHSDPNKIPGVRIRRSGKWRAEITVNTKRMYLGTFDTLLDAACARKSAETRHWL